MTEAEWLTSDPEALVNCFEALVAEEWHFGSARKCRLFTVACCRKVAVQVRLRGADLLLVVEQGADGVADAAEVRQYGRILEQIINPFRVPASLLPVVQIALDGSLAPAEIVARTFRAMRASTAIPPPHLVPLLRDIFPNPFAAPRFDPAWRTSDVVALARGIYADRAFDRMPILADALQDAGCDNDEVLSHCRDTNAHHVRGCWAVDLVLGKE
jgi:hypothetical protein